MAVTLFLLVAGCSAPTRDDGAGDQAALKTSAQHANAIALRGDIEAEFPATQVFHLSVVQPPPPDTLDGVPLAPQAPPACRVEDDGGHSPDDYAFPAAGSTALFTNDSGETLLLNTFVVTNEFTKPGANYAWFKPEMGPGLDVADESTVPAGFVGQVVRLAPGESVLATFPAIERSSDVSVEARFGCKSGAEFAKRPRFSYGAQIHFIWQP